MPINQGEPLADTQVSLCPRGQGVTPVPVAVSSVSCKSLRGRKASRCLSALAAARGDAGGCPEEYGDWHGQEIRSAGREGGRGCLLWVSGVARPSPGAEALRADSLKVLEVHPGAQRGDCEEGPPTLTPVGAQRAAKPEAQSEAAWAGGLAVSPPPVVTLERFQSAARYPGMKKPTPIDGTLPSN